MRACVQGAAGVPALQLLARRATARTSSCKKVPAHRLRRRHAQRAGGAGGSRCRPQGHLRAGARARRAGGEGAHRQARRRRDMQGGCFTISSLGGIGGTAFTPIINAPEVAILGVSRSSMQPVYQEGGFVPRLMLPLSLSYDHRVIDGAMAARFTTFLRTRSRSRAPCSRRCCEPRRSHRPGSRQLQRRGRRRRAGEGRRRRRGRYAAGHARDRQGLHGRAGDGRRQGHRGAAQARRQGVQGRAHRAAGVRRRRCHGGRPGERGPAAAPAPPGSRNRDRRRHGPHARRRAAAPPRGPARTSTAARSCWCSAPGRAATRPHSAPPTSGSRSRWWSAGRRSVASA